MSGAKKLILVSIIFVPVIDASKKDKMVLARVPYIYYLLQFQRNNYNKMRALKNFSSKVNKMIPIYASKLDI